MTMSPHISRRLKDGALLIILTLLVALPGLARMTVIDRDEARYAQATVQMLETTEFVDIRFQDQPRWKKPAGAYWAQAATIKTAQVLGVSPETARKIWVHRIPSVLGALLAVLATYWGGARIVGRDAAMIGAALLAVSFSLVFEAHVAKTDALLAGFSGLCLASLCHLRGGGGRKSALLFWLALGLAVMMKGPITPVIVIACLLALLIWERDAKWMRPLAFWLGPLLFLAIVAPWTYLIWDKTDGQFFSVAIGEDLAPKLSGGAEKHGGPIGYYSATVWAMFWPGVIFLISGLSLAVRSIWTQHKNPDAPEAMARASKLLLCWALPWWIIVELAPTKLPHYTLPVYPALALLAGASAAILLREREFTITRRLGAVIYALIGMVLALGLTAALMFYGPHPSWQFILSGALVLIILISAALMWQAPKNLKLRKWGLAGVILSAIGVHGLAFGAVLPAANKLTVSKNVAAMLTDSDYALPLAKTQSVFSPHYAEPSLVYYLGTHIALGSDADIADLAALPDGALLILDSLHTKGPALKDRITQSAEMGQACFTTIGGIEGVNYSKGDEVVLVVLKKLPTCPAVQ